MDTDRTTNELIEYLGKFTDGKKYVQILEKYRQSLNDGIQIQFSEDDLYWISFLKKRLEKKAEVEKFQNYTCNLDNKQFADFLTLSNLVLIKISGDTIYDIPEVTNFMLFEEEKNNDNSK